MGKYSSDSDSSDSGRGGRKSKSSKRSHRSKGRSPSPESSSRHKSDSYSSRHKKKCKSRRSRSRERYSGNSSRSRRGGKYSRRSSSSSSSDSRTKSTKRSPSTSSSSTNHSTKNPVLPIQELPLIGSGSNDLLSSTEQLRLKVQRAIQAASELKQRKAEEQLLAAPVISQSSIDEINSAGFVQRSFLSAPRNVPDIPLPVLVDLTAEPKKDDSGIVSSVLLDDEAAREDRWARKLLSLRQQARIKMYGEKTVLQTS